MGKPRNNKALGLLVKNSSQHRTRTHFHKIVHSEKTRSLNLKDNIVIFVVPYLRIREPDRRGLEAGGQRQITEGKNVASFKGLK